MKLYKVILADGRGEFVPADTYSADNEQYVFFANGSPIPDVFFRAESVLGITVAEDNYEPPDVKWARFVQQNQMPESDYGTDSFEDQYRA